MKLLSIDPGSATAGVVLVETGAPDRLLYSMTIILAKFKKEFRTREKFFGCIDDLLHIVIDAYKPDLIACEAAHVNHQYPKSGLAISECIGVVKRVAAEAGLEVRLVQPSQWKLDVTGDGNTDYKTVRMFLQARIKADLSGLTEHELAAIGVALSVAAREETRRRENEQMHRLYRR